MLRVGTILSRMVLPNDTRGQSGLYYRCSGKAQVKNNVLYMEAGTIVRFNTYFNAVPYGKYIRYSTITSVGFSVKAAGRADVSLICAAQNLEESILESKLIQGEINDYRLRPVELQSLPPNGLLFLQIKAQESSVLFSGQFETEQVPMNDIRVAAVICTYHREDYVLRNCSVMQREVFDNLESPIHDSLDVIIVDNGKSLTAKETDRLKIYSNKNYGGSGGFSRGMIEALRCGDKYSHILFMDDDIAFEPEILTKTIQLLKYADRPYCIGGQMLQEDAPNIQYESGGYYVNGRLKAANRGLDTADIKSLLENCKEGHVDYSAWWYCCIPLENARKFGLPMPFFIKEDDVEYGIRLGQEFLLMNGIGVWHKSFDDKYSPHLEYYIKRNELIVSAIYGNYDGVWNSMWKLFRTSVKKILNGDSAAMQFIYRAYFDFLKGPAFFYQRQADQLNTELLEAKKALIPAGRFSIILGFLNAFPQLLCRFAAEYPKVQKDFRAEHRKLTSPGFWCKQLGIAPLEN